MEKDNHSNEIPDVEQDAQIIPFRKRLPIDLAKAILRHPASGTESIEETLHRLNITDNRFDSNPDDE